MTNTSLDYMVKCDCGWHGSATALSRAPDRLQEDEVVYSCPLCRGVSALARACDEPGCMETQIATVGWPANNNRRYRMTCAKHAVDALAEILSGTEADISSKANVAPQEGLHDEP